MSIVERAELEARISEVVSRFHREQQGHSPSRAYTTILPSMVVVVCDGIFTPTEQTLCQSEEGRKLIQSARREQRALTRRSIEAEVSRQLDREVVRSYYDLDVRVAQQIEIYMLSDPA